MVTQLERKARQSRQGNSGIVYSFHAQFNKCAASLQTTATNLLKPDASE